MAEEKDWLEGKEGANIAEEIEEDVLTIVDDLEVAETSGENVSPEGAEDMDA